jgi:dTDP-4-amino-4,6-dideoxygalactose transaminase
MHGMTMIADCSHALGTRYSDASGNRRAGDGHYEKAATFSFHPVKTVAMGEGGAITTNDPELAARMARLRNHGMTREPAEFSCVEQAMASDGTANPWYYEMQELGYNYRASDVHCALGASQLTRLHRFLSTRQALVEQYDRMLKPFSPIIRPVARVRNAEVGWHLYVVLVGFDQLGIPRANVMRELQAARIGTQVHYLPVHRQPYYRARYGEQSLSGADAYYAQALSLPLHVSMTSEDVQRVVDALTKTLGIDRPV